MFVVIEGKILKEVCEMELARLRQGYGARVELVKKWKRKWIRHSMLSKS